MKSHNLPDDSALPRMLERLAYALQVMAGIPISYHRTVKGPTSGTYRVIVEYREEDVGRLAVKLADQLIAAARSSAAFDVDAAVKELRGVDENIRLGPSTGSIVRAAEARDIPTRRLNDGSLVQLGWGARQRRILAAETDRTGSIAETIAG